MRADDSRATSSALPAQHAQASFLATSFSLRLTPALPAWPRAAPRAPPGPRACAMSASRGIFLAVVTRTLVSPACRREREESARTDLGKDLDDALSRLGARLEEEQPALLGVLLCLLARHLPPRLARLAPVGTVVSSTCGGPGVVTTGRLGRVVVRGRVAVVVAARLNVGGTGGSRRLVVARGPDEVNLVAGERDDDAAQAAPGQPVSLRSKAAKTCLGLACLWSSLTQVLAWSSEAFVEERAGQPCGCREPRRRLDTTHRLGHVVDDDGGLGVAVVHG